MAKMSEGDPKGFMFHDEKTVALLSNRRQALSRHQMHVRPVWLMLHCLLQVWSQPLLTYATVDIT